MIKRNKETPLKAIQAKCMECAGGSLDRIESCIASACPLFSFRYGIKPKTNILGHSKPFIIRIANS